MQSSKLKIVLVFYLLNLVNSLDFDCTGIPPLQLNEHPTDCHAFVICINENPMASNCPDGMHFSFEEQNCVSGVCDYTTTEGTTTTEHIITPTSTEEPILSTTTMEDTTSEVVTEQTTTDEKTTTEEKTTTIETTIEQTSTTEETTTEDKTTISETTTTEEITTEIDTTITAESELTTIDLPETPNPEIEEGIECPRDRPNENIFFPSKIDCERYYICNTGNIYSMWCREGLHFNDETNKCDYPEYANCVLDIDNGEVDEDGIPLCNQTIEMYYLPHPHKCSYFIFCLHGNRYISPCPLYKSWDIKLEQCVDSSLATCAPGAN